MTSTLNQLGPFQIQVQLVPGTEVRVYQAIDTRTQHTVVLYVLAGRAEQLASLQENLHQKTRSALQLQCEQIVPLQEIGEAEGYLYAATSPLSGATLANYLQQRKSLLPAQEVVSMVAGLAAGLDAAHQHDLMHLALTLNEIWITEGGQAQILGLGVPRWINPTLQPATTHAERPAFLADASPFTAPEQVRGDEHIDRRADVYSLGVIAYYLLLGQLPIEESDPALLPAHIANRPPTPPEIVKPDLPRSIVSVLKFVLAKEPSLRYARAGEFVAALRQAQGWEGGVSSTSLPVQRAKPQPRLRSILYTRYAWLTAGVLTLLIVGLLLVRWYERLPSEPALSMSTGSVEQALAGGLLAPLALTATIELAASVTSIGTLDTRSPTQPTASSRDRMVTVAPMAATAGLTARQVTSTPTPDPTPDASQNGAVVSLTAGVTATIPTNTVAATPTSTPVPTATNTPQSTATATLAPSTTFTPQPSATKAPTALPTATPQPAGTRRIVDAAIAPAPFKLYFPFMAHRTLLPGAVNRAANLRNGPGTAFPIVRRVAAGEAIVLVACAQACTWYQLASGEWIAAFLVDGVANPLALVLAAPTESPE